MNVLIFVTTILMLLGMISYGRMSMYFTTKITETIFEDYMKKAERADYQTLADDLYNSLVKTNGKKSSSDKTPPIKATRNISLRFLLNSEFKKSHPEQAEQIKILLANLMHTLFDKQEWFQKKLTNRPQLIEELIQAMIESTENLSKEKKIKNAQDIERLILDDEELNEALYLMTKSTPYLNETYKTNNTQSDFLVTEPDHSQIDNNQPVEEEMKSGQSPAGFHSLLDYVNFSTYSKIRVSLAPPIVLEAVFNNKEIVTEIIKERKELLKQALADVNVEELKKTFELKFSDYKKPTIDPSSLDFSISKSSP